MGAQAAAAPSVLGPAAAAAVKACELDAASEGWAPTGALLPSAPHNVETAMSSLRDAARVDPERVPAVRRGGKRQPEQPRQLPLAASPVDGSLIEAEATVTSHNRFQKRGPRPP